MTHRDYIAAKTEHEPGCLRSDADLYGCTCPVADILKAWDAREKALNALAKRGTHHDTSPTTCLPANDVGAVHSFYVGWCKQMDGWVRNFARRALEGE